MSKNDITGDEIKSKPVSDEYRTNYEKINWKVDNLQNGDFRIFDDEDFITNPIHYRDTKIEYLPE